MDDLKVPSINMTEFISAFFRDRGLTAEELTFNSLPGDGSNRTFWRIIPSRSETSFIAMQNAPTNSFSKRENLAYLKIGGHLFQRGLPVPEIHRFDLKSGWFIMEDLGHKNLQETVAHNKNPMAFYERVIEILFRLQIEGSRGFNTAWCCQTEKYDYDVMRRYESDYFKDAFLCNLLGLKRNWPELEGPFHHLAETACRADSHFFLHRDFQSRNIMVSDKKIGILDWQGGRLGPLPYDLASLLIDPYVEPPAHERDQIFQGYMQLLGDYRPKWVDPFKKYFPYLAIQRNLQILGAFSFLSRVRGKSYFEAYIAPALKSLRGLLYDLRDAKLLPLRNLVNSLPLTLASS